MKLTELFDQPSSSKQSKLLPDKEDDKEQEGMYIYM